MEIIYEDVLSEEYLDEMAKIKTAGNFRNDFSILLVANPDKNRIGNPYFKVYNNIDYSKATKVARLSFIRPELITGHSERNGKKEWILKDISITNREEIVRYLKSPSGRNPNVSVWTDIRYEWNNIKNYVSDIKAYTEGKYDTPENLNNEDYVPYNLQIPDYINRLQNDKKGR